MRTRRPRLPLTALRTFEAAARLQSFKDAAEELCVSATTVSNQIRALERDWGCLLFERRTRQVVLTDTGRALARVVQDAFAAIQAGIEAHVGAARQPVTLALGPIFAARWLGPRLTRFHQAAPQIELILHHGPRISGAATMTTDIAVDWGHGDWAGLEARKLFEIRYAPVLSPALAARHGGLERPADLARYPAIHQHDRSEWAAWLALAGVPGLRFAEETVIVDSNVVTQAAIDGQGVALGIFPFHAGEVETGRLMKPFDIDLAPTRAYHLLTRPGGRRRPEVATVCDWLEAEAHGG